MKRKTLNFVAGAALLVAMQIPAYAVDTGIDWLAISGFGTLATTYANIEKNSGASFNRSITDGSGARDSWTWGTDSRAGVQLAATINPKFSATVMLLDRRNAYGNYNPSIEWASLKYQFSPDIAVRAGRIGLPTFLISDYLNVGYSQPWLRPPVDVYRSMSFTHVDGADAVVRFNFGKTTFTVQPVFGTSSFQMAILPAGTVIDNKAKTVMGANFVLENGPWTARFSNTQFETKNEAMADKIKDNFSNLGLVYDQNDILVQGELVLRRTNTIPFLGFGNFNSTMGYVTAGYHFGSVMPNVTFSRLLDQSTTGIQFTSQDTISLGVRWDFYRNLALKGQWDHIARSGGRSSFAPGIPGAIGNFYTYAGSPFAQDDKSVNVVGVGLDFVF